MLDVCTHKSESAGRIKSGPVIIRGAHFLPACYKDRIRTSYHYVYKKTKAGYKSVIVNDTTHQVHGRLTFNKP
jgi:hypothetical protein